jgi:BASS family bile acid:Na+ symporter
MPLLAWGLTRGLGMPPALQLGFIILGACPGGTASNVIVYLSRGNVALSVTMTACSTLLAVFLTPTLIWGLGGEVIPISFWALLWSVTKIVLLPVTAGLIVHRLLGPKAERANALFPALSVLIIVLVIACIVGLAHDRLPEAGALVLTGVFVHNLLGLGTGYGLARCFRLGPQDCRTVAIEVGMQNSGLGVALATLHAPQLPLVALPASIFSLIHNLTGALLARYFCQRPATAKQGEATP